MSCTTRKGNDYVTNVGETINADENYLKRLEYRINYLDYESVNRLCFQDKDICELKATLKCKDDCLKGLKRICWSIHEKCIINNYNRWKNTEGMFK